VALGALVLVRRSSSRPAAAAVAPTALDR